MPKYKVYSPWADDIVEAKSPEAAKKRFLEIVLYEASRSNAQNELDVEELPERCVERLTDL